MTTLPTLIQQLRTHRTDSLTELREAIAVVAEAVVAERDELRETLERERTSNGDLLASVFIANTRAMNTAVERDIAMRERDAARTEVEQLTKELGSTITQRDAHLENAHLIAEQRDNAFRQRDTARAETQRLTADRDRLAAEVKTIAETTERETVERIAACIRRRFDGTRWTRDVADLVDALDDGEWK